MSRRSRAARRRLSRPTSAHYEQDLTLQHPRCVFQIAEADISRATRPKWSSATAASPKTRSSTPRTSIAPPPVRKKPRAICYALGWTQHSSGVQIIRCAAILQLLLGNMGRPGGGIMALRGHASIQGSTDIPTLFDILARLLEHAQIRRRIAGPSPAYIKKYKPRTGWWNNFDKYIVSLLKAYYGEAASPENDFGFNWLPRVTGDHSHQGYWLEMLDGKIDGLFVMGQNPAVAGPNSGMERRATEQAEVAGRPRNGGNRNRIVLVRLARSRSAANSAPKTSKPKSF